MRHLSSLVAILAFTLPVGLFALSAPASAATRSPHHIVRHHTMTHHVSHVSKHASVRAHGKHTMVAS